MQWYKRWQSWRERHPYINAGLTALGLLITAPGLISDLKTWGEFIRSITLPTITLPKDWERWLFVISGLTIVFVANDIPGKLIKRFGSRNKPKTKLVPTVRTGLTFSKLSFVDSKYDQDRLQAALTGKAPFNRIWYLTIENLGPNDVAGVSVSVSKVVRHPRNPGDETHDRIENALGRHFYSLPFANFGHNKQDFPVGHQADIVFLSYDWNKKQDSFVIGGSPGTYFAHLDRVHTMTVQIVAMGQTVPVTKNFQVWVQDGQLKVADNSLHFV